MCKNNIFFILQVLLACKQYIEFNHVTLYTAFRNNIMWLTFVSDSDMLLVLTIRDLIKRQ